MDIAIEYDGEFPNLCSGTLVVTIDGKRWNFPDFCMVSGGGVSWGGEEDVVDKGPWSINNWPRGFPEDQKTAVLDKINEVVPWGCCGGCI